MVWKSSIVVLSECLECALEVFLEHSRADDFLTLLALRTRLSVVLAHMLVVGSAEPNDALLSFMAHIDSHEHCLFADFVSEI